MARAKKANVEPRIERPGAVGFMPPMFRRGWVGAFVLLAMVAVIYARAYGGEFLWDDDANVLRNLALRSLAGLRDIWLQPGATQQYYPLTNTSWWLEYHLWGAHPLGFHVINILLHGCGAILLWLVLRRLAVPGAWLGAALFAVHPVNVESVAWITERKNTLAGVFFLASLLAGIKFWLTDKAEEKSPHGEWKYYWLMFALYLYALWSKTASVGLPVVMLLVIWWKKKRVAWGDIGLLAPLLAMGAGLGLVTMWVEKHTLGATGMDWDFSVAQRVLLAGRVFWFYLGKLAWPHPLMFLYPRWKINPAQLLAYLPLVALVAAVIGLWRWRNGWARPVLFTVGYFIVMIFPVMGFFNVYFFRFSLVCDHFQYLACMGPLALAAAGLTKLCVEFRNRIYLVAPVVWLATLAGLTWAQTGIYQNRETLWRDSLSHNPDSWMAQNNLGFVLLQSGRAPEAIEHFERALDIRPEDAEAQNNLGAIFLQADRPDQAMDHFKKAVEIKPDYAAAWANLAGALAQKRRISEAIDDYNHALSLNSNDIGAHVNLGDLLFQQLRVTEASAHYTEAIRLAQAAGRAELAQQLSAELQRRTGR